jgi:glutamate racemase
LSSVIADVIGSGVRLIDSAEETAAATQRVLQSAGLLAADDASASLRVVASDAPERFLSLGRRFLDDSMRHVEHVTLP